MTPFTGCAELLHVVMINSLARDPLVARGDSIFGRLPGAPKRITSPPASEKISFLPLSSSSETGNKWLSVKWRKLRVSAPRLELGPRIYDRALGVRSGSKKQSPMT